MQQHFLLFTTHAETKPRKPKTKIRRRRITLKNAHICTKKESKRAKNKSTTPMSIRRMNEPTNQHITHNLAYTKQQNANDVYLT